MKKISQIVQIKQIQSRYEKSAQSAKSARANIYYRLQSGIIPSLVQEVWTQKKFLPTFWRLEIRVKWYENSRWKKSRRLCRLSRVNQDMKNLHNQLNLREQIFSYRSQSGITLSSVQEVWSQKKFLPMFWRLKIRVKWYENSKWKKSRRLCRLSRFKSRYEKSAQSAKSARANILL